MADRALSTSRRTLLGAAASLPVLALPSPARAEPVEALPCPGAVLWHERLIRYRRLAARAHAAAEAGWFRAANDRYNRESADPAADREAAFARITRAEDLYWHRCTAPMQEAALALVLTPAPDLEAVREKLCAFRVHEIYELDSLPYDCLKVLDEDVGRLSDWTPPAMSGAYPP